MASAESLSRAERVVASRDEGRVELDGVTVAFPSPEGTRVAVRDVDLTVPPGEFTAVVGPSGCGKTTLLNVLAGLLQPTEGSAAIDGRVVTGTRKDIGYLFQRDALLPWKTVLDNVMLPLRFRRVPKDEASERARSWIERVRLGGFEGHYPHQLSGGMRKRVALATVFVYSPRLLLMDEPFAALDVQTRNLMENELLELWGLTRPTVLFVTHDLEEAIAMADRVVVCTSGPARVKADYAIALPRPRELTEIRFSEAFEHLHRTIWADLRSEVLDAYEASDRISSDGT